VPGDENESRVIKIPTKQNDKIEATLGYYLVNPKSAKKLKITDKELLKFRVLKSLVQEQ